MNRRAALGQLGLGLAALPALAHTTIPKPLAKRPVSPFSTGPLAPSDYTVYLSPKLDTLILDVHRPMTVLPGVPKGREFLKRAIRAAPDGALTPIALVDGAIPAQPGATARLVFDAAAISRETVGGRRGERPDVRHLWPALWLWRPRLLRDGPRTINFDIGPRAISTPWPRQADGAWRLDDSAFQYRSRVIIGAFEQWEAPVNQGAAQIAWLGAPALRPTLKPWVQAALKGVEALHPHFPKHPQIVLFDEPGDDIGFGTALRGGGGGVSVWVGRRATPANIRTDWTLVHELLHLGMPHLRGADAWLSEGITQYHTYIAQARAGVLTPAQAWREIHAGFGRGRSAENGRALSVESANLGRYYNYWFVYWAGAAFAFQLDVWLRARGEDLPGLLAHWYQAKGGCCDGERTAGQLLARADAWAKASTPGDWARAALAADRMPDLSDAYRQAGLNPDGSMASGATIAHAIMTGR